MNSLHAWCLFVLSTARCDKMSLLFSFSRLHTITLTLGMDNTHDFEYPPPHALSVFVDEIWHPLDWPSLHVNLNWEQKIESDLLEDNIEFVTSRHNGKQAAPG